MAPSGTLAMAAVWLPDYGGRISLAMGTFSDLDTLADEARFFSHRRRTLAGGGPLGHQLSAIML